MTNQIAVREEVSLKQQEPSAQNTAAIARHFIKSGYFQDVTDESKAVVKILAGQEIGIGPFAAMTGINVIKGRITLSANLIASQIKHSSKYNFHVKELTEQICTLEFFEQGKTVGLSSFSMTDATKAGLVGGVNWKNYPRNMLFARAISNGAKWYCPDVFGGTPVYTPDELDAPVDPQTGEMLPEPAQEPSPEAQWVGIGGTEGAGVVSSPEGVITSTSRAPASVMELLNRGMKELGYKDRAEMFAVLGIESAVELASPEKLAAAWNLLVEAVR